MRLKLIIFYVFIIGFALKAEKSDSTHISFNGQITAWGIGQFQTPVPTQFGGRFVPTLLGNFKLSPKTKLDFEASLNLNGSLNNTGFHTDTVLGQLKPYRVWLRYSGDNWELRAGLQKINFGSAKMFRPLMWFDNMDVRDPLQLTDGVYGILGKYFLEDNSNYWLWMLFGNSNRLKGFETIETSYTQPEFGGRFEHPLGPGQFGISTHYRKIDYQTNTQYLKSDETRIGLDGKWDLGVGIWFESSIVYTDNKRIPQIPSFQDLWNVGIDYTFPLGNGLGATEEYFRFHTGNEILVKGTALDVLGTMLTYPVSLLDNFSGMLFYFPGYNLTMNYLSWTRTYDNLSIYVIGYWNPDNVLLFSTQAQSKNLFAGKGIQLMLNYNF